jgi:hypothetical protein
VAIVDRGLRVFKTSRVRLLNIVSTLSVLWKQELSCAEDYSISVKLYRKYEKPISIAAKQTKVHGSSVLISCHGYLASTLECWNSSCYMSAW